MQSGLVQSATEAYDLAIGEWQAKKKMHVRMCTLPK
jgi:hypothetical protein